MMSSFEEAFSAELARASGCSGIGGYARWLASGACVRQMQDFGTSVAGTAQPPAIAILAGVNMGACLLHYATSTRFDVRRVRTRRTGVKAFTRRANAAALRRPCAVR